MAKLSRITQLIFGSTAGTNQRAVFGSLAAASPAFTTSPATMQSLSNWLEGWFGAVVGGNSPAIEDLNSFCYVIAYQLAYLFQSGVPEWDSGTTYYTGSLVNSGGVLYVSIADNNTNHAVTNPTYWRLSGNNFVAINPATQSPYTMAAVDLKTLFMVNSVNGAMVFLLPNPASVGNNFSFKIKDTGFDFSVNACLLVPFGAEKIENVAGNYTMQASGGHWEIATNGTDWFIIGE